MDDRESRADERSDERSEAERMADHGRIDRLAGELLPALAAKLSATDLGEIEVREGDWKVRLRRPADAGPRYGRRASDRPSRAQPGHAGHGHAPAAVEGHRPGARAGPDGRAPVADGNGSRPLLVAVGPGSGEASAALERSEPGETVATSPAVGYYAPRPDLRPGMKVRAGDRLGVVDVLGIPQEIAAPIDGVVGASLVEPGQAVEYGQELIVLAPTAAPPMVGEG